MEQGGANISVNLDNSASTRLPNSASASASVEVEYHYHYYHLFHQ